MKRLLGLTYAVFCGLTGLYAQNPPTPTNLVGQSLPGNHPEVSLTWQVPFGPWSFKIYRSHADSSHFGLEGWSSSPSYRDHEVLLAHTYFYYVTSVNNSTHAESPRSDIVQVTVNTSRPHGYISGTITADAGGQPISNVRIRVFRLSLEPYWSAPTETNPAGQYQVEVDTGVYFIKAEPPMHSPYQQEWYDNAPTPSSATPVRVNEGLSATANFGLARTNPTTLAYVHGVVRSSTGAPLPGTSVVFMRTIQEMNFLAATTGLPPGLGDEERTIPSLGYTRGVMWYGQTNNFGEYYAHVPIGSSYIAAAAKNGYLPEYFNNKSDPTQADIITVSDDTSGIDFSLAPHVSTGNSVRGTVRDTTGQPVPSRVILFPKPPGTTPPATTRFVHSDTLGNFDLGEVNPGVYNLLAVPYSNFVASFYKEGAYGVINWQQSDSITVSGLLSGINVGVVPVVSPGLTRIAGSMTILSGSPIAGGRLVVRTSTGQTVGFGVSDGTGNFSIDAVPAGQVTVFGDRNGFTAAQGTILIPPNTYTINSNIVLGGTGPTGLDEASLVPYSFELHQSFPNPFNPATTIRYSIKERTRVVLKVFNVLGKEVASLVDEVQDAGLRSVRFDASKLASGVYFYRLEAGNFVDTKKTLLLR